MAKETPNGSKNVRMHCRSCGDYVAEDARATLGVYALPLSLSDESSELGAYRPNMHIFYGSRAVDADDHLPKWETLPQGKLLGGTRPESRKGGYDEVSGRYFKDALPPWSQRAPEPAQYTFTETDPGVNHSMHIAEEKLAERLERKYLPSPNPFVAPASKK
eukprot:gene26575-32628_t